MKTISILMLAGIMISAASINPLNAQSMNGKTESKKVTAGRDQLGSIAPKFAELNDDVLFGQVWSREAELSPRDRSLVTIVSLIAGGNFEQLKFHLQKGKDNGLSKQEIAEIITHQAFYSGWPKAWSAFNIVKEVYGEIDTVKNTNLAKSDFSAKEHLVRISEIEVYPQYLDDYLNAAKKVGEISVDTESGVICIYPMQVKHDKSQIRILEIYADKQAYEQHIKSAHFQKYKQGTLHMVKSLDLVDTEALNPQTLYSIFLKAQHEADTVKNTSLENSTIFPLGDPVNPQWFIGKAWLRMISTDNPFNTPVGNVTFAPGARNHWHSHKIGQILLVTGGEGWYQEWGKPAQKLKEGDAVNIPANVKHWHGATKDSWFVHLAITPGESEWFEPVTDEEYNSVNQ